jgi:predicted ATPase
MITSMHIENFKCFKDFDIELGPFNVLIGPNDSGKTALFQAIRLAVSAPDSPQHELLERFVREYMPLGELGPSESWYWRGEREEAIKIDVTASAMDAPEDFRRHFVMVSKIGILGREKPVAEKIKSPESFDKKGQKSKDWKSYSFGKIDYLQLDAIALREPTRLSAEFTQTGKGLPTLVEKIRGDVEKFSLFQNEFCERFPYYKRIGSKFIPQKDTDLVGIEFVTKYDNTIPAVGVSDGVILSLAFLAIKYTCEAPCHRVFLIEEPENGVHPANLREIVDTLRHISEKKGVQVILTTHSPYLLDLLKAEDVRVFSKDVEGAVHAVKLSDFPDVEGMRKHFGAGEIWTAFDDRQIVETVRGKK